MKFIKNLFLLIFIVCITFSLLTIWKDNLNNTNDSINGSWYFLSSKETGFIQGKIIINNKNNSFNLKFKESKSIKQFLNFINQEQKLQNNFIYKFKYLSKLKGKNLHIYIKKINMYLNFYLFKHEWIVSLEFQNIIEKPLLILNKSSSPKDSEIIEDFTKTKYIF